MANRKIWSKSECLEAALKCTNRSEFQLKYRKQYDFAWRNKFLNNICSHMSNKKQSKITFEKCFKIALKHNSRSSFKKNHQSLYQTSRKNGWLNDICQHMNKLLNNWTFNDCKTLASKYNTKVEFKTNHGGAYVKARKMKWLNKICEHMESAKYGCKKSDFIKACKRNNNDYGIFYVIKCYNEK